MALNDKQEELCKTNRQGFSDLKAVLINCTLKTKENQAHTRLLLSVAEDIMKKSGVGVDHIHAAAHQVAYGVQPDMTGHGRDRSLSDGAQWPTTAGDSQADSLRKAVSLSLACTMSRTTHHRLDT